MPFIAKDKNSGEEIDITAFKYPRLELRENDIVCRFCNTEMFIRGGEERKVCHHFVHKSGCTTKVLYRKDQCPESAEHLMLKYKLRQELPTEFSEYANAKPQLEYIVKDGDIFRIIDLAMIFPNGWIIGHEIQLSKITIQELEKRTSDYERAGIDVIWWFGKDANTPDNRRWSVERLGFSFTFDFINDTSRFSGVL